MEIRREAPQSTADGTPPKPFPHPGEERSRTIPWSILDNSRDAIGISLQGSYTYVNAAFAFLFGFSSPDELMGTPILDRVAPESRDLVAANMEARIRNQSEASSDYEIVALRRDGSKRDLEVRVSSYFAAENHYTLVILRDVTERKREAKKQRDREARYRSLFEDSPTAVWEEDFSAIKAEFDALRSGGIADIGEWLRQNPEEVRRLAGLIRIIDVNQASVTLLGAREKAELSPSLPDIFDVESYSVFREELAALAEGRTHFHAEIPLRNLHGQRILTELSLIVQPGHEEDLSRVLISSLDITERSKAEAAIRKALAEKEVLLRELYHRTRNNMSVIIGMLDLQAQSYDDERMKAAFAESQVRIGSLALVHQKLMDAKDLSHLNLADYIKDLIGLVLRALGVAPESVSFVTELEEISVIFDSALPCGLILSELLSNSLKHAFPGRSGGTIRISLSQSGDGSINLHFSDDGVGFPPGFDPRRDGKLGLRSMVDLAESQLGGQLAFDTTAGVACRLSFHDSHYAPRV
ncbi:MAG: PAS domain S-box protein [Spirochaetota bacterium]